MAEKKLITILTPMYNRGPYIQTYVEGLAKQSYLDRMKIIVVNDCSTDDSLKQLKKYSRKYSLPVEILNNDKNMGIAYSIFRLYRLIDTKYWAVLDPDDYYISPDHVKKAVEFLESHPDHSCYACNQRCLYSDGSERDMLPSNFPSQSFAQQRNAPFFQTACATFRNFFTPELLDTLDEIVQGRRDSAFRADGFRNSLAYNFGKLYYDNSVDTAWRMDVGIWGTLSRVEQDISNMTSHLEYFKFFRDQFGVNDNAMYCLQLSWNYYNRLLDEFVAHMKATDIFRFEADTFYRKDTDNNGHRIIDALIKQCKAFNDAGIQVK